MGNEGLFLINRPLRRERPMQQSKQDKPVLARFILVRADPNTLTMEEAHDILHFLLPTLVKGQFRSFAAIAESTVPPDGLRSKVRDWSYVGMDGRIIRDSVDTVRDVLRQKYADEMEHKRHKGHKSTVAPPYLIPEKLVVVMGSGYFLAYHIELYLERQGLLRSKTFECLRDLHRLKPWAGKEGGGNDFFLDVLVTEEKFYPGNFDAYAAAVGLSVAKARSLADLLDIEE